MLQAAAIDAVPNIKGNKSPPKLPHDFILLCPIISPQAWLTAYAKESLDLARAFRGIWMEQEDCVLRSVKKGTITILNPLSSFAVGRFDV